MPPAVLIWSIAVGMVSHAVHWTAQAEFGIGAAPAAALASLVAGSLLSPVSHRFHLPLSGVRFCRDGVDAARYFYLPVGSALFIIGQHDAASDPKLLAGAVGEGIMASVVVLGITFGFVFPKAIFDSWRRFSAPVVNHATHREG